MLNIVSNATSKIGVCLSAHQNLTYFVLHFRWHLAADCGIDWISKNNATRAAPIAHGISDKQTAIISVLSTSVCSILPLCFSTLMVRPLSLLGYDFLKAHPHWFATGAGSVFSTMISLLLFWVDTYLLSTRRSYDRWLHSRILDSALVWPPSGTHTCGKSPNRHIDKCTIRAANLV